MHCKKYPSVTNTLDSHWVWISYFLHTSWTNEQMGWDTVNPHCFQCKSAHFKNILQTTWPLLWKQLPETSLKTSWIQTTFPSWSLITGDTRFNLMMELFFDGYFLQCAVKQPGSDRRYLDFKSSRCVDHSPSSWKRAACICSMIAGILSHWHSARYRSSSASSRSWVKETRDAIAALSRWWLYSPDTMGVTADYQEK